MRLIQKSLAVLLLAAVLPALLSCSGTEADRLDAEVGRPYQAGRYAEAIPLAQRSLAIREKALGPEHPDVATGLNNLAALYEAQGEYGKAEPLYKRSLAIVEKTLGPEHPHLATVLNNLALVYQAQGRYAKAEPLYKRSLAIREKALGPQHPQVATALNNLAVLYRAQDRGAPSPGPKNTGEGAPCGDREGRGRRAPFLQGDRLPLRSREDDGDRRDPRGQAHIPEHPLRLQRGRTETGVPRSTG